MRAVKSSRIFRNDRNRARSGSNLANTTFSMESSRGEIPSGEEDGKERSLGFKAAINPLWPFLKPSACERWSARLLPDCIPRYLSFGPPPPHVLEFTRVLSSANFRLIATIFVDVGGIFTNSIVNAVSREKSATFLRIRRCMNQEHITLWTLDSVVDAS